MYNASTSSSSRPTARCPVVVGSEAHRRCCCSIISSGEYCCRRSRRRRRRRLRSKNARDTEDDTGSEEEERHHHHHHPFDVFTPSSSTDETVVGAEGVPQFIIEAERKAVPLLRPRLAAYAISSSVAAAQLVYILQESSSLESPMLAAASDVCDDRQQLTVERRTERTSETTEKNMERSERERNGDDESRTRARRDGVDGEDEGT